MAYYVHNNGLPANQTRGIASQTRSELDAIAASFGLLPSASALWSGQPGYLVDTGAANAYAVTANSQVLAYADGQTFLVKATNANTGAATLNVSGLGAKVITRADGNPLVTGDIIAGQIIQVSYNATSGKFQLFSAGQQGIQGVPGVAGLITRSARTSNTVLANADSARLIDITSGTFSQTFAACTTLGAGWYVWLRNSGSGDITLDPNAAETIDGLATFIMYPGEARLIQCDGSVLRSVVLSPFSRNYTASDTFTKPPGYSKFGGLAWSGGNSGQRNNNLASISQGGGGGGYFNFTLEAASVGATETVTIGAGGLAVTTIANGNSGGTTSFGSWISVFACGTFTNGGSAVLNRLAPAPGGAQLSPLGYEGAVAVNGVPGTAFWGGAASCADGSSASGSSIYGGGAGASVDAAGVIRAAGTSNFGGAGGAAATNTNGTAGTAPGGGGGATQTGTQSGAGARGELRIWGLA